ncbi:hypothetical protein BGW37DRAFT_157478 [Umbelopsis sp. PMI_123]|nr:hypothetical protein BGW37DRAFT_157478 [Umbelopsis sp. PMI_123]
MALPLDQRRRVALAYDGTEDAQKLFKWAITNIIKPDSDHIILLSAVSASEGRRGSGSGTESMLRRRLSLPMTSASPSEVNAMVNDPDHKDIAGSDLAKQRLQDMAAELHTLYATSEEHILWGDPVHLIPKFTQNHSVDLLIIGSRGLSKVKSVFVGSVSEKCVHECPCPVLVVRNTTI